MPRLVPGGNWVYGWVIAGPGPALPIPPAAWRKYGFQAGGEALLLCGSRTSGGFGLANAARIPAHLATRVLGRARFDEEGRVALPAIAPVRPGDRLLAVLGSGFALGFVARGPIYQAALGRDEIEVFG
jgi:hypothetical protein